ncbi:hypothetical protein T01_7172 [Trichinella spiralis]|uniref:Uncharacterized protein n=1 Tax=Trichinella spiralis TaxID=6334 RepID=A0A0V1C1P6_TRISP|nr:hypothetical protein T01_7172 [Trichinella spiralis]
MAANCWPLLMLTVLVDSYYSSHTVIHFTLCHSLYNCTLTSLLVVSCDLGRSGHSGFLRSSHQCNGRSLFILISFAEHFCETISATATLRCIAVAKPRAADNAQNAINHKSYYPTFRMESKDSSTVQQKQYEMKKKYANVIKKPKTDEEEKKCQSTYNCDYVNVG